MVKIKQYFYFTFDKYNGFFLHKIDWDICSKTCGGGIQKRRRSCLNNDNKCSECLEETRLCNESPCPGKIIFIKKKTEK